MAEIEMQNNRKNGNEKPRSNRSRQTVAQKKTVKSDERPRRQGEGQRKRSSSEQSTKETANPQGRSSNAKRKTSNTAMVPPTNRKKKKNYKVFIAIGVILLVALVGFLGFRSFYSSMLKPVGNDTKTMILEIPEDSTIKDVSAILEEQGLIRNTLVFESYAGRKSRSSSGLQAGNYEVNKAMSVEELVAKMLDGDVYSGAIPVVLPEGRNINEMAQLLEQHNICSAQNFIAETKKLAEYKSQYPILSSVPDDKNRTLEGYLFADTYDFEPKSSASDVVNRMLSRFTEVYDQNFMQETTEKGKTVDETVIMASIIELETKLPEDKANAASVFYNRIAQGMPLQSDITVDYALGKKHPVLTEEQTKINSPYNTYMNLGLPVGPICSPSKSSISAALNPAQTKYIFFVADMNSGKLYFNETLEGHDADVRKYMGE